MSPIVPVDSGVLPYGLDDLGWLSALFLGLSVGLTTCTAVCLPYLGTWAFGRGKGGKAAAMDTLAFAAGKVTAYAMLGALAAQLGKHLLQMLNGDLGHWLIGLVAVLSGLVLIFPRGRSRHCSLRSREAASPYLMGFALSFAPCAPLAALLAASAGAGDLVLGGLYGLLFGLGAAFTPLFLVIPLLGGLGRNLQQEHPWIGPWLLRGGGAVLIAIGLNRVPWTL